MLTILEILSLDQGKPVSSECSGTLTVNISKHVDFYTYSRNVVYAGEESTYASFTMTILVLSSFIMWKIISQQNGNCREYDPKSILQSLKEKNADRPVVAHLNINSIAPKFNALELLIKDNIDLLLVSETKIDDIFSTEQFRIEGYSRPIRLDRDRHGGGIMFLVRDDLPCHELSAHSLPANIECTFLEMTIRKSKWLIVGV